LGNPRGMPPVLRLTTRSTGPARTIYGALGKEGSGGMKCQEFLEAYTVVSDGLADEAEAARVRTHRERCACCDRYARVLERGVALLEGLPSVEPSDAFRPRLEHRLLHVDEELAALRRGGAVSATTGAAALAIAILFLAVAWSASIQASPPRVTLPAILAVPPAPVSPGPWRMSPMDQGPLRLAPARLFPADLWQPSPSTQPTLYEYSPLRYRYETAGARSGLD
jgi:hypothetical protein